MPDFATDFLANLLEFGFLAVVVIAVWVGISRSIKHGLLAFGVGIVLLGVATGFVEDPEGAVGSAWEFIQSDVLGL